MTEFLLMWSPQLSSSGGGFGSVALIYEQKKLATIAHQEQVKVKVTPEAVDWLHITFKLDQNNKPLRHLTLKALNNLYFVA